jgi:glycosyltransferase involved in cell wall biosynthesis
MSSHDNNKSFAETDGSALPFGAVAIGRNEGKRLRVCLESLTAASIIIYVDSGSSDGSVKMARSFGAYVVELDQRTPFSAARARNAGFAHLLEVHPDLAFLQFIDGDCELDAQWPRAAIELLQAKSDVAAVCGRLRERFPQRSIYNWLCDREWDRPTGEVRACAGNVMMRVAALAAAGGYREDVIAAEEDELCVRLRNMKWRIWRTSDEMGLHDAAMMHFSQWWRRSMRAGYAFAQGCHLHGHTPERHFVLETRRALVWGFLLPLVCAVASFALFPYGLTIFLFYPLQLLRLYWRNSGAPKQRAQLAFFQLLARFPEMLGAIRFLSDKWLGHPPRIIEHKAF